MALPDFTITLCPFVAPLDAGAIKTLGIKGLNCGSGISLLPKPWLNTDRRTLTGCEGNSSASGAISLLRLKDSHACALYLEHDAKQLFPFEDAVFQWIMSEHFIEHLTPGQAVTWLKECRRLLEPGGTMRISTPDLELYTEGYLQREKTFLHQQNEDIVKMFPQLIDGQVSPESAVGESLVLWLSSANPAVPESEIMEMVQNPEQRESLIKHLKQKSNRRAFMVNQAFQFWQHKWIYDLDELKFVAGEAGFNPEAVKQTAFGEGEVRGFDVPFRRHESIYVEIQKDTLQ
jgi:ubiquinone/menaquinone biosynthesis C-methylase UbiE